MRNEREFLIEQILAQRQDPEPDGPAGESQCPDVMLLMAGALDQAPSEKVREVDEHCATCADCRTRLAAYREFVHDLNVPEPPYEGSLLERMAERREFVPKRPRLPEDPSAPSPPEDDSTAAGSMLEEFAAGPDDLVVDEPQPVEEDTTEPTGDDGSTPQPFGDDSTAVSSGPTATQETSSSPAEAGRPAAERVAGTVTQLAEAVLRDPEMWKWMAKRLRPWLAAILRRSGADPAKVDELLAFVRERLFATPPREHYRPPILQWVQEFVAVPRHPIDRAIIEQAALDQVLEQVGEYEPPEARQFREEALKQALPSSQALLQFAPEAVARAKWLPTFRLQLFYEAEKLKVKGLKFFQWN